MIFQDLLKQCDVSKVIKSPLIYLSEEDQHLTKKQLFELCATFIDSLCEMEPTPNDRNAVILGQLYTPMFPDEKSIFDVCMYERQELINAKKVFEQILSLPDEKQISDEEIEQALDALPKERPNGYAFEFTPWEEVLGWEISMDNVRKCGEVDFIAMVLEEITFNGFTRESQNARKKELDISLEEVDEILALPKEEQGNHFIPWNDVFRELNEKYGILFEQKSEEEKKKEKIKKYRTMYQNAKEQAKMVCKYLTEEHL